MKLKLKGQSLIEFALIIPIVILLFTVFLDLGRGIYYYSEIQNAAREGTRFAIVLPVDTADYTQAIKDRIKSVAPELGLSDGQITIDEPAPPGNMNVGVTITFQFKSVTPGLSRILGGADGFTLSAKSVSRIAPGAQ